MNEENTQKLYNDFPNLYRQHVLPMSQTSMCFGFQCGDGWFDLIYDLSKKISEICPECEATCVKQKFAGLRFYVDNSNDEVEELISLADNESFKTCELCGSKDKVIVIKAAWIESLCKSCRKKEYPYYYFKLFISRLLRPFRKILTQFS